MASDDESKLVIEFEDTGEQFDQTTSFTIQSSFTTPADAWSCTVVNEESPWELRRKFYPGRPVKLYLGDRLQVIGRLGSTTGRGSALEVRGRDYFADLIDPNIDPSVRINNRMTLADALIEGLRQLGITEVESSLEEVTSKKMGPVIYQRERVQSTETVPFFPNASGVEALLSTGGTSFLTRKVAVTEQVRDTMPRKGGEGAYQWAARLAAKYHLTVQPGSKRSAIALVAPDYESDVRFAFSRPGNIETATCTRNGEDVPTFVNASGRFVDGKESADGGFSGISLADEGSGFLSSNEGRRFVEASKMVSGRIKRGKQHKPPNLYKPIYFTDDRVKSADELRSSATRMLANKLRGFFSYTAMVNTHSDVATGATYATNTMAEVKDGVEDVGERLWVVETNISKGNGQGKRAAVKMIIPGTYVI